MLTKSHYSTTSLGDHHQFDFFEFFWQLQQVFYIEDPHQVVEHIDQHSLWAEACNLVYRIWDDESTFSLFYDTTDSPSNIPDLHVHNLASDVLHIRSAQLRSLLRREEQFVIIGKVEISS